MTLIEFIVFIFTMVAFFFLIIKQSLEKRNRETETEEQDVDRRLPVIRDIVESLELKTDSLPSKKRQIKESNHKKPRPNPHEKTNSAGENKTQVDSLSRMKENYYNPQPKRNIFIDFHEEQKEDRPQSSQERQRTRVQILLATGSATKDAIILKEILGPPKGLQ